MAGQIGRATAVIMVWSLVDKALAIGKEMLTAHRFGISASLDVFNVAYSFPGIVVLFFSGALVSAFVPLYLEWRSRSDYEADSHATWLIYLSGLFFALLALICFVLTPEIIHTIGYGLMPEEKKLGVIMERMLIFLIFIDGTGILFRGILHARKLFFHLYVAPIFVNITIIGFLLFDVGLNIYALIWGFLIGTLLKTLYMGIWLHREGFRYATPLPFDRQKMKAFWLLAIPMLGSELIANSNLLVDQVMATQLPAGSVSTLRYAFRINDFPIQVIITAISRAIFPFISEELAADRDTNLQNIFKYSLIFMGVITIPITCLMVLFSEDLVIVLLKRGAFDLEAARQTGQTLVCYSLGLVFYAYSFVNEVFFAALKKAKTLLYLGFVSIILNALFNLIFMNIWGVKGIAMSTSLTMGIISIWFVFLLKRSLGIINLSKTLSSFSRIILSAAAMLGAGMTMIKLFEMTSISRLIFIPASAVSVSLVYIGILWLFRTAELDACITLLVKNIIMWKNA